MLNVSFFVFPGVFVAFLYFLTFKNKFKIQFRATTFKLFFL